MDRACALRGPHCLGDTSNQWRKISATDWACSSCWIEMMKASRKKDDKSDNKKQTTKNNESSADKLVELPHSKPKSLVKKNDPQPLRVESLEGTKVCPRCGELKAKSKFGLRTMKRQKGTATVRVLQSLCSTCRSKKGKINEGI